jgi:NAD-dependent deacetylase
MSTDISRVISHLKTISDPKIVVLTGAGISAESGIETFRDNNGLWENHKMEEVATPEAFERNPELVHRFYNARRQQLLSAAVAPNPAHFALAKLEKSLNQNLVLITQNVDNLHEEAGSKNVIHMHGEILSAKCPNTNSAIHINYDLSTGTTCRCCQPAQPMRPNIVWFGEMPYFMDDIQSYLAEADLFVSIGTSGNVYPAAGFVQIANHAGAVSLELNLAPSAGQSAFIECRYGQASAVVPAFVNELCEIL